jgi:hypothetical protein
MVRVGEALLGDLSSGQVVSGSGVSAESITILLPVIAVSYLLRCSFQINRSLACLCFPHKDITLLVPRTSKPSHPFAWRPYVR